MSIQANDFSTNSLTGTVQVSGGTISLDIGVLPMLLEGDKSFDIEFRKGLTGPFFAKTNTITIRDYSNLISFTANTSSINENDAVKFTLVTSNVNGNLTLYYTTVGNVNYNDFVGGNTGSFLLTNNYAEIVLTANSDLSDTIEVGETISLQIRRDSVTRDVITTSNFVEIIDISNVAGIDNIITSSNSIYESESVIFTVNTFNGGGNAAAIFYYTVIGNADIIGNTSGEIIINDNVANLELIAEASVPDGESREFAVQFRRNSVSGPILQTSGNVLVYSDGTPQGMVVTGGTSFNIEI